MGHSYHGGIRAAAARSTLTSRRLEPMSSIQQAIPAPLRRRITLSSEGIHLVLAGLSVIGYLLCLRALIDHGIFKHGGAGGGDVIAYWTAGANLLSGEPLYNQGVGGYAAYLYPPPLAQLFALPSQLPFPTVVWLWRAVVLSSLRVAVGSWRGAGIAMLLWPPVIAELDAGNVHLLMAAAVAMMIRGQGTWLLPAALTKFASLAAVPVALRDDPRGLLKGAGIAAGIVLVSFALAPSLWLDYAHFMTGVSTVDSSWYNLGALVPLPLRLGLAAAVAIAALRWRRLLAVAATLALPVLWFHGLSMLIAVVARPRARRVAGD